MRFFHLFLLSALTSHPTYESFHFMTLGANWNEFVCSQPENARLPQGEWKGIIFNFNSICRKVHHPWCCFHFSLHKLYIAILTIILISFLLTLLLLLRRMAWIKGGKIQFCCWCNWSGNWKYFLLKQRKIEWATGYSSTIAHFQIVLPLHMAFLIAIKRFINITCRCNFQESIQFQFRMRLYHVTAIIEKPINFEIYTRQIFGKL